MLRIRIGARRGLRGGAFGIATFAAVLALGYNATQAAPYADIVVDANSGSVLHATNPDARRHPASLTKIMTLYLLFEQLEAGKLKLDSQLKVSAEAAGQDPTKLGLRAGATIEVEDAIKGIVTRSANDAAVVVAEAIGGDEETFAKLMTQKAQALGMTRTVYRNASGLPDDDQVTTARDQAILGRAIQERFPRYYKYFSTRSFTFRGQRIGNHNRLLGHVDGVDGIKTGYIHASGFNLVTSVHRGNRYIVAVIMGGTSAGSRDAKMRELISQKIALASVSRTASMVAEAADSRTEIKVAAKPEPRPEPKVAAKPAKPEPKVAAKPESRPDAKADGKPRLSIASTTSMPAQLAPTAATAEPLPAGALALAPVGSGSADPIRPVLVRTVTVKAGAHPTPVAPTLAPVAPPPAEPIVAAPPAAEPYAAWLAPAATNPDVAPPPPAFIAAPKPPSARTARIQVAEAPPAPPAPAPAASPAPLPVASAVPPVAPAAAVRPLPPVPPPSARAARAVVAEALPAPAPAPATALSLAPAPTASTMPAIAPAVAKPVPAMTPPNARAARVAEAPPAPAPAAAKQATRNGWMIQVGAYPAEQEAKQRLTVVQGKAAKVLTGADPFTESVDKGGTTLYRARFAGLDKDQAEAACKFLKRDGVDCVTIRN